MSNTIELIIEAKDHASAALVKVGNTVGTSAEKMGRDWKTALGGISSAWLQVGAIIAAGAWFTQAASKSLEAEVAFNKLNITVDNMGLSYKALTPEIEKALAKTKDYAIVQDEDVAAVLQKLILHTGNYKKSLDSLNIVYDLAYLKNIDAGEAATLYGKAIAGNVEGLGRLFPELRNIDTILGEFATTADKAAYAQAFFAEKVSGASDKMTEHEKAVKRVLAAYEDIHQFIGSVIIGVLDTQIGRLTQTIDLYHDLADVISRITKPLNIDIVDVAKTLIGANAIGKAATALSFMSEAAEKNTTGLKGVASAIDLVVKKTSEQIAAESRAASDRAKASKEATEEAKKNAADLISAAKAASIARLKALEAPAGTNFLTSFFAGKLDFGPIAEKMKTIGLDIGGKFGTDIKTGTQSTLDNVGDLNFTMPDISFDKTIGAAIDSWDVLNDHITQTAITAQGMLTATFDTFASGAGNAVASVIVYGESLGAALGSLIKSVAANVISMLVQIGVQRLVQWLLEKVLLVNQASAQIATNVAAAGTGAFAQAVSTLPFPLGIPVGIGYAATAIAKATGIALAGGAAGAAAGAGIAGIAHGGLENVPTEGTYLLDKGERVLAPRQNKDLESFMQGGGGGVTIRELNIMPYASIDAALFNKPTEWWVRLAKQQILPALNVLGKANATTTLRPTTSRI